KSQQHTPGLPGRLEGLSPVVRGPSVGTLARLAPNRSPILNRSRGDAQDLQPRATAHYHQPGSPSGWPTFARYHAECRRERSLEGNQAQKSGGATSEEDVAAAQSLRRD